MAKNPTPTEAENCSPFPAAVSIDWPRALSQHDRWLRTSLFARLGIWQAVEEVMQEVSLAAISHKTPLCDPSRVGAWLYRVALRQSLMYRRRMGRYRKFLGGFARERSDEASTKPDPLNLLLSDERKILVRKALAKLSAIDAQILLLKYTEDWSYRELSLHLGVSESCIETRLHRARQRLRESILASDAMDSAE
ncbi:RNA polymerase sigma factor [Telmatocola sphagniphila]|uniref:RNA polymerase sigma factor n=1 Tax=Telmatocola sphagniphila TaxID=1123043 RepID=A0A8E6B576_9BACT|nr:RNA polymerase sigma factor [Telmatocola sphagniphila]QVL32142.1 RNA polymerase sigma factor [Telmatocola sphagniphila]